MKIHDANVDVDLSKETEVTLSKETKVNLSKEHDNNDPEVQNQGRQSPSKRKIMMTSKFKEFKTTSIRFQCSYCNRKFSEDLNLKQHIKKLQEKKIETKKDSTSSRLKQVNIDEKDVIVPNFDQLENPQSFQPKEPKK